MFFKRCDLCVETWFQTMNSDKKICDKCKYTLKEEYKKIQIKSEYREFVESRIIAKKLIK